MIQTTFAKEENPLPPPPPPPPPFPPALPPLKSLRTKNKIAADRRRARTDEILFKIVTDGRRARTIFLTLSGIQCTGGGAHQQHPLLLFLGILPCTNPHCKSKLLQLTSQNKSISATIPQVIFQQQQQQHRNLCFCLYPPIHMVQSLQ